MVIRPPRWVDDREKDEVVITSVVRYHRISVKWRTAQPLSYNTKSKEESNPKTGNVRRGTRI